jgi:hypothetical protein
MARIYAALYIGTVPSSKAPGRLYLGEEIGTV